MAAKTLTLASFSIAQHQLAYTARVGDLSFSTSYWFDSVDFHALADRFGADAVEVLCFHAIAFDLNRLLSLAPERVDFGPLAHRVTPELAELWRRIFDGVWAQWRYENDLPGYRCPELLITGADPDAPLAVEPGEVTTLAFCGGGKDSLLACKLLEEVEEPFDSLVYSHSIYGDHGQQHALVDRLLDCCAPRRRHRVWIFDDFLPAPVVELTPGLETRTLTAAETPASLFLGLPIALAHGFEQLVLAHEKSADVGNLHWETTGEEINHQWGKSLAAEILLDEYVRRHLIRNLRYFSLLKPIQDAVIFPSLRAWPGALPAAHSCNVDKPWCRRCAKCAYVWLLYRAFLPGEIIDSIFGENLLDPPENQVWFRQMLGLAEHTPFECVGQVEEARLAFELLRRQGLEGRAMEIYRQAFPEGELPPGWRELFTVEGNPHRIPSRLAERVLPLLRRWAEEAKRGVESILPATC